MMKHQLLLVVVFVITAVVARQCGALAVGCIIISIAITYVIAIIFMRLRSFLLALQKSHKQSLDLVASRQIANLSDNVNRSKDKQSNSPEEAYQPKYDKYHREKYHYTNTQYDKSQSDTKIGGHYLPLVGVFYAVKRILSTKRKRYL